MIRVVVKDFQAIHSLELGIDGIVFVTGPSNNGKSSLVRALESCIYNKTGETFIRDGADTTLVGMDFQQPDTPPVTVAWKKPRGGGATYVVTTPSGKDTYPKSGKGPLPEVLQHGFHELSTARNTFHLHFWHQLEAFLVSEPNTVIFEVLSRLLQDRQVIPILSTMKTDWTATRDNMLQLEGKHLALREEQKSVSEQFTRLDTVIPQLRTATDALLHAQARLPRLVRLSENRANNQAIVAGLTRRRDALNRIGPEIADLLQKVQQGFQRHTQLTDLSQRFRHSLRQNIQYHLYADKLAPIAKITPPLTQWERIRKLEELQHRIQPLQKKLDQTRKIQEVLQPITGITLPQALWDRLQKLNHLKQQLEQANKATTTLRETLGTLQFDIAVATEEYETFKRDELKGQCPICHHPLHEEGSHE